MRKSTKGVVAGSAAALLLLGGLGTRAEWSSAENMDGTDVGAGSLDLVGVRCDGWEIGTDAFNPNQTKIVPGSVLTQVCTFRIDADGYGLEATLSASTPTLSGDTELAEALAVEATFVDTGTGGTLDAVTSVDDGSVVEATLTVTLPATAGNSVQDLSATLNDITVTATQAV